MAVLAGLMQLHKLAETYVERGIAVAEKVNQPSNLITVNVVTCVYQITVGKWDDVRTRGMEAKAICERLGDYRQWGDATVLLGESALLAGDILYALDIQKILLENARQRRNPLQQCWGMFGVAANSIRLGKEADVIPLLEEALQILEEIPNFASSVNTNGQLALAHYRLGAVEKALAFAGRVLDLAENISPTVYSLDVGFAAVSEVYFEVLENALRNPDRKREAEEYKKSAEKAIKLLQAFMRRFPIGQAYLAYYQGWYDWLAGKPQVAVRGWQRGLEAAQKYNLLYEEGLIRLKLGVALKDKPAEQKEHLERAAGIFEKMGAVRELGVARQTLEMES
jgi:tetratricopeptide (TPR) repeat protein